MTSKQYEKYVAGYFQSKGYNIELTKSSNDYGVDVFATKGADKIAIQAKMFGGTARKINRQMVMELQGAKKYFDCTHAVLVTDGEIINNALEVAQKINIEILFLPAKNSEATTVTNSKNQEESDTVDFDYIWEKYIQKLEGVTLIREDGNTNTITKVDWSGIERITSNGKKQKIKIEIFKKAINHILEYGSITRDFINQEYKERASSGIVLILSQIPIFEYVAKPSRIFFKK